MVDIYLYQIFCFDEPGQIRETCNVALLNGAIQCVFDLFENVGCEFILDNHTKMVDCALEYRWKMNGRIEIIGI